MDSKSCKPHLVYIITTLELGGAQKICLSLFEESLKKYGNATLISSGIGSLADQTKSKFGNKVVYLSFFHNKFSLFSLWRDLLTVIYLVYHLICIQRSSMRVIVHTHSSKAGILGRMAASLAGCKNIVHTVHGFAFHSDFGFLIRSIAFISEFLGTLLSSKIICVSHRDRNFGSKYFWGFKNKSVIFRAFVEDKFFNHKKILRTSFSHKQLRLGTVSCFKPQKNLLDALKSIYILKKYYLPNMFITFDIVGDGHLRKILESSIQDYGLSENVRLLGWQKDVSSFFRSWDVFILTSLWEGLPCALVEALLSSLPVACYDSGGCHEIILPHKNGFLVKETSPFNMAKSVHLIYKNQIACFDKINLQQFSKGLVLSQSFKVYDKTFFRTP